MVTLTLTGPLRSCVFPAAAEEVQKYVHLCDSSSQHYIDRREERNAHKHQPGHGCMCKEVKEHQLLRLQQKTE